VNLERIVLHDGARPNAIHQLVLGDEVTCRLGWTLIRSDILQDTEHGSYST